MFLERRFTSSSLTRYYACATATCQRKKVRCTCQRKKVRCLLTSGIKLSWPLSSRNIAFPTQSLNRSLRCTTPCKERLNDRNITQFIHQYPCCQVMSRLKILVKTHPFTCASYNPFESLHIDHIGPLPPDDKVYTHILVMIDAFSH